MNISISISERLSANHRAFQCRVNPSIKFAGTHLYTWVNRGTVRVKCFVQEHNTLSRPGLEPGPLDPGTSALTMRPPRLHLVVYHSDLTNHSCILFAVGAAFGKGVYFARDAAYSYLYATRSGACVGNRCMYLSRVLVGEYCKGNEDMIVPPAKDPSRPEILFDSVVNDPRNPSIFVVFFDNQCYPEYLIKF